MTALLLDTHAWVWSLLGQERLSHPARQAIETAEAVFVSPISFYEIGQKVRVGKWPEMEPILPELSGLLEAQGARPAVMSPEICLQAAVLPWMHRDPFDRLIASTALVQNLRLVSRDVAFDGLEYDSRRIDRIW